MEEAVIPFPRPHSEAGIQLDTNYSQLVLGPPVKQRTDRQREQEGLNAMGWVWRGVRRIVMYIDTDHQTPPPLRHFVAMHDPGDPSPLIIFTSQLRSAARTTNVHLPIGTTDRL